MANIEDSKSKSAWSTWEELLLASAVRRHGTKKWNSVAMEIQNRRSFSHPVTPQICKQKFRDLQQRFSQTDEIKMDDERSEQDNHGVIDIPWLDELRNLRVAELRRELQRSDLLIVSLQLKVKKLEEEHNLSLKEKENPDLEMKDAEKQEDETKRTSPSENRSENRNTGDESDRESKSNLTDSKGINQDSTIEIPNAKPLDHSEAGTGKPDLVTGDCSDEKAVDEVSCNGSCDTMTKEKNLSLTGNSTGPSTAPENGELANFHDSIGESKESSDVQSSVSLSNKRRKEPLAGNCSEEELDTGEVSPLSRRLSVKSQPLASFLETIRSHQTASLLERLPEIQESSDYRKLIRQHVDLETVKTRLEGGQYSGNNLDFFRDLLLIFNNAVAFFPKASAESLVAVQLRRLVSKEVDTKIRRAEITLPRLPPKLPPLLKSDTDVSISVEKIDKFSGAITCKKRSSITGKKFVDNNRVEIDNYSHHLSSLQEERLRKLQQRLAIPFDASCPDHQESLKQLWKLAYPNRELSSIKTELWKEMGWQGADPSTDFRGGGFISLENLIFFASKYPDSFQSLLHKRDGIRAEWEYPFAVAGINISFMLVQFLDLQSGRPKTVAGNRFLELLEEDERAFDHLYCVAFQMMDAQWLAKRASYMEFNEVLKSTRNQLERELSLEDLSSIKDIPAYNMLIR